MRLIIIDSSSKQNAALVEKNGAAVLIDCGVSLKALKTALADIGLTEECIKAVFITHSHSDHIKGLPALSKLLNVPFYSAVDIELCQRIYDTVTEGEFSVTPFRCSHDVPCVGYRIESGEKTVCIATDTGKITSETECAFEGCDVAMIESNHDIDMLRFGHYPPSLKSRILADTGHLSNSDCAKFVTALASRGLPKAVLAHISENNNTPLVAKKTTLDSLAKYGFCDTEVITANKGVIIEV